MSLRETSPLRYLWKGQVFGPRAKRMGGGPMCREAQSRKGPGSKPALKKKKQGNKDAALLEKGRRPRPSGVRGTTRTSFMKAKTGGVSIFARRRLFGDKQLPCEGIKAFKRF